MNDRLKSAFEALDGLEELRSILKPVQFADQRENALVECLHALAEQFGHRICHTYIDSNGEMDFNIVGEHGEGPGRPSGRYGEELAAILSTVSRRTGITPTDAPVLPENGWTRINHFNVERLLHNARDMIPEVVREPEQVPPAPKFGI